MGDWIEFLLASGLFLVSHPLPQATGLRRAAVARIGRPAWLILYSAVSLLLFGWMIAAAGRAPFVPLWEPQVWHRVAVNLAMPLAFLLGTFGVAAPNPFAFEGRRDGFDPDRPGIAGITRQPLLWAMVLWAGAHLLMNGDLAHLLLFAPMLIFALAGIALAERAARRRLGADWPHLAARTGLLPLAALIRGKWQPRRLPSLWRFVLALALWAAVWHLHPAVIGVWPGV